MLISQKKSFLLFWGTVLGSLLFISGSLSALAIINHGEIIHGLSVGSLELGGLKINQAKELLQNETSSFSDATITLTYGEKSWITTPQKLGLEIDLEKTFTQALAFGQEASFFVDLLVQAKTLTFGQSLSLLYSVNSKKLNEFLSGPSIIETQPQNASLKYNNQNNSFEIIAGKTGLIIDKIALFNEVLRNFTQSSFDIKLSLVEVAPLVNEENLAEVKKDAEALLENSPFSIRSPELSWQIEKEKMAEWISASPLALPDKKPELALDQNKIKDFLTQIAPLINREAIESNLVWQDDEVKFATMPRDGQKLSVEKSAEKITQEILAGKTEINLIIEAVPPKINDTNLEALGFKKMIGWGESNFSGSSANRKKNIATGATKLNGLVIKPGEEFSFGQRIGDIDAANGWVPELVIKNNQTIPEYGGGLCQVSTTLFRAAVNSGLKITERHPHAYPVKYYEPAGFDATVYPPSPDLKFINDTPNNILFQSKISGTKLIFEIFGTTDDRQVKIIGPTTLSSKPDGSKKTLLKQQIWRDGQMEREALFYSNYKSPDLYPVVSPSPAPSPTP